MESSNKDKVLPMKEKSLLIIDNLILISTLVIADILEA